MKVGPSDSKVETRMSLRDQVDLVSRRYDLENALILRDRVTDSIAVREAILYAATVRRSRLKESVDKFLARDVSEKLGRVQRVWRVAVDIYAGNEAEARGFLNR